MDSIQLEFRSDKEARAFVKKIKNITKITKCLTIYHLYLLYRMETGITVKNQGPDDIKYGWPYRLLSGITVKDTNVIFPTFIKIRSKDL